MKPGKTPYNPFEPLTEKLLEQLLAGGYRYWVVQRFPWPGIAAGKGFIASPYRDRPEAEGHGAALAPTEGKLLDGVTDAPKILNLTDGTSDYTVLLNVFRDRDWQQKMKKSYGRQIMAFIRQRTNLFPKGGAVVEVHFYLNSGRLYADLQCGDRSTTAPACDMIF